MALDLTNSIRVIKSSREDGFNNLIGIRYAARSRMRASAASTLFTRESLGEALAGRDFSRDLAVRRRSVLSDPKSTPHDARPWPSWRWSSYIGEAAIAQHAIALDQLIDPRIEADVGAPSRALEFLVADDIVPLVGVFAHERLEIGETGNMGGNASAELQFGQVRLRKPDVVGFSLHLVPMVDRVDERLGDVADVYEISSEVRLEQHNRTVVHGAPDKIVDKEVEFASAAPCRIPSPVAG